MSISVNTCVMPGWACMGDTLLVYMNWPFSSRIHLILMCLYSMIPQYNKVKTSHMLLRVFIAGGAWSNQGLPYSLILDQGHIICNIKHQVPGSPDSGNFKSGNVRTRYMLL